MNSAGRPDNSTARQNQNASEPTSQVVSPPTISLPKGGGAIHGIGEKFTTIPVTGTGSMSVPIAISPSRSGFSPQLALSYDSGIGNSAFGLGWNLTLHAITRKTDKGLPKYKDTEESDVFVLSDSEDLVPVGSETSDTSNTYSIQRYRPRLEGLFALIEHWTELASQKSHWRSISKDNVTTLYGRTDESRIFDPDNPTHIFSWLICACYDDKGNAIRYQYKAENSDGIDLSATNEKHRSRSAQRYLKRIYYGNKSPYQSSEDLAQRTDWMFEIVFDYGEHYTENGPTNDDQSQPTIVRIEDNQRAWVVRQDPFSSYRSGFETRTYRLCQRVLMFHHFAELGTANYLVRATHFKYHPNPSASFITAVTQSSYLLQGGTYVKKSLPPVEFEYSEAQIDESIHDVDEASLENLPYGLDGSSYQWVDLDGEGLSGILTEQGGAWFYKRNLGAMSNSKTNVALQANLHFAPLECLPTMPSPAYLSRGQQLLDLAGDGQLDVVVFDGSAPGFFERTANEGWETFASFQCLPNVAWNDPNLKFVDLTGDGHADMLFAEDDVFTWYPSLAEKGFGSAEKVRHLFEDEGGPRLVFADGTQSIYLADLSGDGLTDLVRIRNGNICYWPNLGYGRFGARVTMTNAPWFDVPDQFDQKRIRLADIDGSGTVDILYLGQDGVYLYFNHAGNSWSAARKLTNFPRTDNLSSVMAVDLLGNGTACLVWSSPLPSDSQRQMRYMDLMGGQKPHLLVKTRNNLGAETEVQYAPSTRFYLQDKRAGRPWITKLPFPVHCVERVVVRDRWRKTRFATTYSYHHGYFDGIEREFRGFGRVEQIDTEDYGTFANGNKASPYITDDQTLYQPPVKTITWYHTGAALDRRRILTQFETEYFPNSFAAHPTTITANSAFKEKSLSEPDLASLKLTDDEWREALRACKGMMLRQEVYELDVDALNPSDAASPKQIPVRLFSVATHNCNIRCLQTRGSNRHAVFLVTESEVLSYQYELDLRPVTVPSGTRNIPALTPDPRITHTLNLSFDEYGNLQQSIAAAYPRLPQYTSPVNEILADRPVGYYRLRDAPEAITAVDLSDHANHGTYSATGVTPGMLGFGGGTAAQFDGLGSGRIIIPDNPALSPNHITIEALIKWAGPNEAQQRILEKSFGPSWSTRTAYSLTLTEDGHVRVEIATQSTQADYFLISTAPVELDTVTHLAMTYDGSTLAIYINGEQDTALPATGNLRSTLRASQLGIGNQVERDRAFKGIIGEVAVYDYALAVDRIRTHVTDPAATFGEPDLAAHRPLIQSIQTEQHLVYTETHYTNDVIEPVSGTTNIEHHRLRVPYEVQTYELTGIKPRQGFYFDLTELRDFQLSDTLPEQGTLPLGKRDYHEPVHTTAALRKVEHALTIFFSDDLTTPLAIGTLNHLGLTYETYKLALTQPLLQAVLGNKLDNATQAIIDTPSISGYLNGVALLGKAGAEQWWMRSGTAGFATDAAQHFYLPERYTDPFGNVTTLQYDSLDLFIQSSQDALGNTSGIWVNPSTGKARFDYRVLAPLEMVDPNGNHSEVWFDVLGLVIAAATKGKQINDRWQGDHLDDFTDAIANPIAADVAAFCTRSTLDVQQTRNWLASASIRFIYHFGDGGGEWAKRMGGACAIVRERHVGQLGTGEESRLQVSLECSDGMGNVLMKKVQAEPDPDSTATTAPLRWIVNGLTVLNNKGKPVKQYEPAFSADFGCELPQANGVTPVMYYDAAGRLIRTELPDGTFSRVEFSPWQVKHFDANDTVNEPSNAWLVNRMAAGASVEDQRAARLSLIHQNTPARTILDSLGREVIAIAHNRVEDSTGSLKINGQHFRDERYLTFTKLDVEGKPLWVRDARGHLVMQYITPAKANNDPSDVMPGASVPCYDIAGNLLFQHSMDAGDRWMLMDASGKPLLAWDANVRNLDNGTTLAESRLFRTQYDALHRPLEQWLTINIDPPVLIEAFDYADTANLTTPVDLADAQSHNLIGQATLHHDPSGLATVVHIDFKGAAEEITRTLVANVEAHVVDWNIADRQVLLESETFIQITEHDALGRMVRHYNWHRGMGSRVAVYEPRYNERGTLVSEDLIVGTAKTASGYDQTTGTRTTAIQDIHYNAKGQKISLELGNGTITRYTYAPDTFRLVHLYTRRDASFTNDCAGDTDAARPARPCGVQNLHYTYDPVGNITHIQDDAQQTIWFANQQVEPSNHYTYDALYRLIEATGRENAAAVGAPPHPEGDWPAGLFPSAANTRNYTQRYQYDGVGNIIILEHIAVAFPRLPSGSWTQQYAYAFDDPAQPASNRLWQTWLGGDRTQAVTHRYDTHGSMINLANTAPAQDMRWDWRDMIRALDLQGGGDAFYNYGIDKQRTRKHIERTGGSEDRIYLSGYELYRRRNAQGDVIEEIESLHLFEGEQRVLLVDDVLVATSQAGPNKLKVKQQTLFRYQYGNHLGSVCVELDETAQVISHEEFHPYGTSAYRLMSLVAEAPAKRYRFTGMERDEESGLNYHLARYYTPRLGRWTSADEIGITGGMCVWAYADFNPVSYKDPTGKQSVIDSNGRLSYANLPINKYIRETDDIVNRGSQAAWDRGDYGLWLLGQVIGAADQFALLPGRALDFIIANPYNAGFDFASPYVNATMKNDWNHFDATRAVTGGVQILGITGSNYLPAPTASNPILRTLQAGSGGASAMGLTESARQLASYAGGDTKQINTSNIDSAIKSGFVFSAVMHGVTEVPAPNIPVTPFGKFFASLQTIHPRDPKPLPPAEGARVLKPTDKPNLGLDTDVVYIYVVDPLGQIIIAPRGDPKTGQKHTQLTGSLSAKAAGELRVVGKGALEINAHSGRYSKQDAAALEAAGNALRSTGMHVKTKELEFR